MLWIDRSAASVAAGDVATNLKLLFRDVVVVWAERLERSAVELGQVALVGLDVVAHQEAATTIVLRRSIAVKRAVVHQAVD